MRHALPALALCLLPASCFAPVKTATTHRNLHALGGGRLLMDEATEPLDEQWMAGLEFDSYRRGDFLGWELGAAVGGDNETVTAPAGLGGDDIDAEALLLELYAGVRHTWDPGPEGIWYPYVGLGACAQRVELELDGDSETDLVPGAYVHGGFYVELIENFDVGIDVRYVWAATDAELQVGDVDMSYAQAAARVGFSF